MTDLDSDVEDAARLYQRRVFTIHKSVDVDLT